MSERIAVIGLGQMGSAVAAHLKDDGFDVMGWDIAAPVRERAAADGIAVAGSAREALAGRPRVLTSLTNADAVRSAWLGEDGIVAHAAEGAILMELSTIEPAAMRDIAAAAQERGLIALDCPVSGGPIEARSGKLIMMAGGDAAAIERAMPVLQSLGATVRHTGDVGTAKVVKIVNNMMAMGNLLIASEAFALGVKAGVEPDKLFEVLAESGGRSQTFTKRFPHALKNDFEPRFKLELAAKDLALGDDLARAEGMPAPAAALVKEMFNLALAEGFRGKDAVALLAMYQRWAEHAAVAVPAASDQENGRKP
ncbi:NAD(P)-dependent oxidoreductase [Afifella sp. IM 167]|uniref:NAD(P)-dependent oxidoreductase n=1 Tax=Afifella sp. IM 167 TaxID=2033586 RepID=UPI001CCF7E1E|nr:NAD(P)-dependent oxidoreductase [Afifella sp. IM 167]MBZ8132378.1 3-hydroxyisobutyrate dehydrogenase [Afifella sp. IM 167]